MTLFTPTHTPPTARAWLLSLPAGAPDPIEPGHLPIVVGTHEGQPAALQWLSGSEVGVVVGAEVAQSVAVPPGRGALVGALWTLLRWMDPS